MLKHKIICGKSEIELKQFDDNTFDSCVTDPPYNLTSMTRPRPDQTKNGSYGKEVPFSRVQSRMGGFMGKEWDGTGISFNVGLWEEVYRVMKPGAHILVFGGTRTYHRMACAVEDAGFEVRDMLTWNYASGFPKSLNIGKQIDKLQGNEREVVGTSNGAGKLMEERPWNQNPEYNKNILVTKGTSEWEGFGTALKPAHEPILLARKPISERNIASNVLKWGVGGINIESCRVGLNGGTKSKGKGVESEICYGNGLNKTGVESINKGRFPANLILECCCEEDELMEGKAKSGGGIQKGINDSIYGQTRGHDIKHFNYGDKNGNEKCLIHTNPNCVCGMLDEQSGELKGPWGKESIDKEGKTNSLFGGLGCINSQNIQRGKENGGASRFFYQAKASQTERWFYCMICKQAYPMKERDKHIHNAPEKTKYKHLEFHPTQKPEKLIAYFARLITPPGGTMLDPFLGSGTGLIAAEREGFNCIGIDSNREYCLISHQRLKNKIEEVQTKLTKEQSTIERIGF